PPARAGRPGDVAAEEQRPAAHRPGARRLGREALGVHRVEAPARLASRLRGELNRRWEIPMICARISGVPVLVAMVLALVGATPGEGPEAGAWCYVLPEPGDPHE